MNPKFIQHDVFVLDWNLICPHVIVGGGGKTIDRNFGAVSITRELNNLGPDKLSPMDHVIGDVDRLKKKSDSSTATTSTTSPNAHAGHSARVSASKLGAGFPAWSDLHKAP